LAAVPLVRCDEANLAMAMLAVAVRPELQSQPWVCCSLGNASNGS
jgi:hypothetical protein